jgi:hypothetical protein
MWQYFEAPGDEYTPLDTPQSPWIDDRFVQIPKEHWQLILAAANEVDGPLADLLRSASHGRESDAYAVALAPDAVAQLPGFLNALEDMFTQRSTPLVEAPSSEFPEDYGNDEHIRMIKAVRAVIEEAVRTGEPYKAWTS